MCPLPRPRQNRKEKHEDGREGTLRGGNSVRGSEWARTDRCQNGLTSDRIDRGAFLLNLAPDRHKRCNLWGIHPSWEPTAPPQTEGLSAGVDRNHLGSSSQAGGDYTSARTTLQANRVLSTTRPMNP